MDEGETVSDGVFQALSALISFALGMLACDMLRRPVSEARMDLYKAMVSAVSAVADAAERLAVRVDALEERTGIRPEGGENVVGAPRTPGNPYGRRLPPPPPPRPTDPLRRQPDVANDGEEVPKVGGR